ncbi:hypothetical protein V1477_001355 [Vespula maculifrons]|uniref:Uncharacterized protein n=1 Tax=Vespula maculifrons TaxID=7453 RepID=A0ABD2D0G7_VESMC
METIIWNIKSHIEAEECFKRQLKILTKEGTSLAIVHLGTRVRGNGRDLSFSKHLTVSGFSWRKFRYETSTASQISPVFHDCLFTPSNIAASYEAYSRTIADKSLSVSLSGLEKLSDRCERSSSSYKYNYVTIGEGKYLSPCVLLSYVPKNSFTNNTNGLNTIRFSRKFHFYIIEMKLILLIHSILIIILLGLGIVAVAIYLYL